MKVGDRNWRGEGQKERVLGERKVTIECGGLFLVLSMCARQRYTYIIIVYKLFKILSR